MRIPWNMPEELIIVYNYIYYSYKFCWAWVEYLIQKIKIAVSGVDIQLLTNLEEIPERLNKYPIQKLKKAFLG